MDGRPGTGSGTGAGRRPRVVVGVDGSDGSRAALRYALPAAADRDADLEVVAAFPVQLYWMGMYPVSAPSVEALGRDVTARTEDLLAEARASVRAAPPPERVHVVTVPGPAVQALLDRAGGADLLVVGSRGRGAVRSALLGSVALHCAGAAPCSVVVVRGEDGGADPAGPGGPVVVGVDGSAASLAALSVAAEEAGRAGSVLEVLAGYRLAEHWSDAYDVLVPSVDAILDEVRRRTAEMVDEAVDGLARAPREIRRAVLEGSAAEALVDRSRDARLLVVGSSGVGGAVRGLLLGSVALHCVLHADCPVQVVRPHPARPAAAAG